jgi:ABC-type branched-subunit amino acid transport system ATPase component
MITELDIKGFRCFKHLHVPGLTRVNLIVGQNNSGKTTVLEAVELLHLGTRALARGPIRRREEMLADTNAPADAPADIDVSQLFHGRELRVGAQFSIEPNGSNFFQCEVAQRLDPNELPDPGIHLKIRRSVAMYSDPVSLSSLGGLDDKWRRAAFAARDTLPDLQFLGPGGTDVRWLARLWDDVTLTPDEATVYDVLRVIERDVERIAFLGSTRRPGTNAFVKLSSVERRLPLGNLGDGMLRLLSLALHLVASRGGVLLVDEIDTGLHHSIMEKMWRLVIETAKRLDVQVFATTHSRDCVDALAYLTEQHLELAADVSAHRIDPGAEETVRYDAENLAIAARHHIEVR